MATTEIRPRNNLDPAFVRLALVLITGILAVVFDTTIVNVALDTLGRELHVRVATVQWVTTAYLLALGMAVPVTGWLIDRLGGKRLWIGALTLFLVGSLGASLAWNAPSLIACRVVQGIGGGLMLPVLTTLLAQAADGRSLGRVTALVTLPVLLGPILGPLVGGLIVQHVSWRWIFWVNVPFCVVGLVLAWRLMPLFPGSGKSRLDAVGLALLSPGIAAVVYGLAQVGVTGGFRHVSVLIPLLGRLALVSVFTLRALAVGAQALVDLRLFRVSSFGAATGLLFLSGFALYGAMLLVPLYFQQVRTIPVMASAYIGLDRTEVPHASIITRTAQQIGGSFGTAVLAVVLERALTQHAVAGLDGRAAAFDVAFWWSIAFTAMAVVLAFWLPNRAPS